MGRKLEKLKSLATLAIGFTVIVSLVSGIFFSVLFLGDLAQRWHIAPATSDIIARFLIGIFMVIGLSAVCYLLILVLMLVGGCSILVGEAVLEKLSAQLMKRREP